MSDAGDTTKIGDTSSANLPIHKAISGMFAPPLGSVDEQPPVNWPPGTCPIPGQPEYVIEDDPDFPPTKFGQGWVFAATGPLKKKAVLKLVCEDVPEVTARVAEWQTLLPNDYVIRFWNSWPLDGRLVIAMPRAKWPLSKRRGDWRGDQPLSPELVHYFRDVATGLDHIHAPGGDVKLGRVHRDIKPANILLFLIKHQFRAVVADPDLSKHASTSVVSHSGWGTQAYMDPDAARRSKFEREHDQYSLAVTFLEMRTGRLDGVIDDPAERAVVEKAMNNVLRQRYGTCIEFVAALESILERDRRQARTRSAGSSQSIDVAASASPTKSSAGGEPRDFMSWLRENRSALPRSELSAGSPLTVPCGSTAVIETGLTHRGFGEIRVKKNVAFPKAQFDETMAPFAGIWQQELEGLSDKKGIKGAPLHVTFPVPEEPELQIRMARVEYKEMRAFSKLVNENLAVRDAFLDSANAFQSSERVVPSTLTIAPVVLLGGASGNPASRSLLLTHRVDRGDGGFHPNTWSATFEEQFSYERVEREGRVVPEDVDPWQTIRRGLKEEIVGERFDGRAEYSMNALCLDLPQFHLVLVGVIKLPDTRFEDIQDIWLRGAPGLEGPAEINQLAIIPLKHKVIEAALKSDSPGDLITQVFNASSTRFKSHKWHPYSKVRLACCLWMLEEELI